MSPTRRLAAILAADVAGYSRLIGTDEGGTLQALKAIRAELIDPTIAAHNGRLVKTTGDGLLVEFGSVVSALGCAADMQAGMAERNSTVPDDWRVEFRIGINVGDVVVEDGDIFGDGVNVAAHLEALAVPGGICVSACVQEDAVGTLDLSFEDLGEQALKNIARPVRAYRIATEMGLHRLGTKSSQTLRWREMDSNYWSRHGDTRYGRAIPAVRNSRPIGSLTQCAGDRTHAICIVDTSLTACICRILKSDAWCPLEGDARLQLAEI